MKVYPSWDVHWTLAELAWMVVDGPSVSQPILVNIDHTLEQAAKKKQFAEIRKGRRRRITVDGRRA